VTSPRRRRHREAGFTVLEMVVAIGLMTVLGAITGPVLVSAMNGASRVQAESDSVDQLRLALVGIGRELRSAECIDQPALNGATSASGPTLDFTTDANGANYEVAYIFTGGTLTRQVAGATAHVLASGIVSGSFVHWSTPRQSVVVQVSVQLDPKQAAQSVTTTVAGRNAWRSC
jgi:type II secretory pathway pseudopilin PulG